MKYVEQGNEFTHSVGYNYDLLNNLTQMVETINGSTRTTSYTYDDDNRITSVTSGSSTREYTYDAYGNRLVMMYDGHVVVDVSGEEKKKLTVEQLLELFSKASGSDEADDKLLLS